MRISTVTMFEQSLNSLASQQDKFLKIGQQISSGSRVVNPSDDPQAASRAVSVGQSAAVNQQYADARITARNSLGQEESVLNSVADAITSAKTLMVQAANGTLSDADRSSVASEIRGIYETLIGQANAADGNGRYLFGGYRDNSPPFVKDPTSGRVTYIGDTGVAEQKVDSSRLMPSSDNGLDIFMSVHSSAKYVAKENATGSVAFVGPTVVDNAATNFGDAFTIKFDGSGGYEVFSPPSAATPSSTGTYDPADPHNKNIAFNGLSLTLEGTPAVGDSITVSRAREADPNLFRAFEEALAVLDSPAGTPEEQARMRNTVSTSMRELSNALDNVLTTRASVGARLNELDVLDSVGSNRALNYAQTLSDLVDLDYNKAISEYALRQVGLQAAQKSFLDIQKLSLFDRM
ncbi:flagellar hook-associated protein FlgL [Geopseudomonas guangdongensis]|uniref:Flagellar hook-associated protein 3 FlgL n=1 Tax=Geopseudomonas guangdongensis TaxID=1245526 RepID=A0A1H2EPZ6_9GAMM|nr:flagellar hook-associated protein FlgL [Pseudomonas guangdongensis]SDT97200.1 flagellar hook-associated protein 3 FlgL [Pseudomonas guangdongensis]